MFDFKNIEELIGPDVPLRVCALIGGYKEPLHALKSGRGEVYATKVWARDTVTISFEGKCVTQSQFQKPDPFVVLVTDDGVEVARFPATLKGSNTQYWKLSGTVQVQVDSNVKIQSTKP
jgi:hypothetical protein